MVTLHTGDDFAPVANLEWSTQDQPHRSLSYDWPQGVCVCVCVCVCFWLRTKMWSTQDQLHRILSYDWLQGVCAHMCMGMRVCVHISISFHACCLVRDQVLMLLVLAKVNKCHSCMIHNAPHDCRQRRPRMLPCEGPSADADNNGRQTCFRNNKNLILTLLVITLLVIAGRGDHACCLVRDQVLMPLVVGSPL
mgnify:CR=1 FL=1